MKFNNPILSGFNPDPSIIRVGNDYYIATSTFEWFPGVQIHHSTDLVNWKVVTHPLKTTQQLDLKGVPDSCGVWAPCLSYHEGIFYLVYSNVKSFDGVWKDTPNYLVTTNDILGEWSAPIYLSSVGFDGSLFHDLNGKKWFTSMIVDHRKGKFFGGIILQEYSQELNRLVDNSKLIFEGSEIGKTEGPHIYQKDGYYYLLTAEGGTEYGHAVSIARAREIEGPYELHPQNPILSAANLPEHPLQKCGHADLVQTKEGYWVIVFLVGRPLSVKGRCILGRETAIEELSWPEGQWPELVNGNRLPRLTNGMEDSEVCKTQIFHEFDGVDMPLDFQSLRIPIAEDWCTLKANPSHVRLYGRESLSSTHNQSLVGCRVQNFHVEVSMKLRFEPIHFQQMAGLVFYYNTAHYHYLYLSAVDNQKVLNVITCDKGRMIEPIEIPIPISSNEVILKGVLNGAELHFAFSNNEKWVPIGEVLDASILSDDYVLNDRGTYKAAFTGAFVAMCCQDLSGSKLFADFDYFRYQEL
jgi:xylan 1,4-beta-xylosidase